MTVALKGSRPVLEERLLLLVEHSRGDPLRLAHVGHRLALQQMQSEDLHLLLATSGVALSDSWFCLLLQVALRPFNPLPSVFN